MSTATPTTLMPAPDAGARPEFDLHWRLRLAREFAGLEQADLSDRAGISRATISTSENGRRVPSRSTLRLWAAATGVAYDWLVGDTFATRDTPKSDVTSRSRVFGRHVDQFGHIATDSRERDGRRNDGRRRNRGGGAR